MHTRVPTQQPPSPSETFLKNLRPFRALFPSWKFFDRTGETPHIEVQLGQIGSQNDAARNPWIPLLANDPRPLRSLVFNPEGNRNFALHTLVGQLVDDLQEVPDETPSVIEKTVSYQLACNWIKEWSSRATRHEGTQPPSFRFRLVSTRVHQPSEVFFESRWIKRDETR